MLHPLSHTPRNLALLLALFIALSAIGAGCHHDHDDAWEREHDSHHDDLHGRPDDNHPHDMDDHHDDHDDHPDDHHY